MTEKLTETRNTFRNWMIWIVLFILPLLFYPKALTSTRVSSNSDIHALLEFFAAGFALVAGGIVLIHFFATGRRFFLLISLGFTLQGAEDLVHAIYSFSRIWPAERVGIVNFVPGTYVIGRLILAICILIALYLEKTASIAKNRRREAITYNSIGFLLATVATAIVINLPLPQFIVPGQIISRPVDFVAAIIYLVAFFFFVKVYRDKEHRTPFMWCMIGSIIFGFATQIYMAHSQQLYDAQFNMSHVVKIFSYIFPIFGIGVGTFIMYKREESMAKELSKSRDEIMSAKDYTDNIIKSMIDTLIVVDADGKIKTINKATSDLLGYKEDELIGKPVATIFAEEEEEEEEEVTPFKGTRMKKLIEEGSIRDYDMTYKTKSGEKIPVSFSGSVMRDKDGNLVGIVGIARDMREIKRLMQKEKELAAAEKKRADELEKAHDASLNIMEDLDRRRKELDDAIKELRETQAKLIQAGKMAAMGTLGAGIAHQLNQPLAGIRGFTQTVLMQMDKKNPFYEDLKKIEEQTGYMRDIILNISGFARTAEFKKVPIDINEPIEKALQLFSEQIRLHGIKLVKNLDPKLPKVNADINQMQQVFVNFITNAREALDDLPKEERKELAITTKRTEYRVQSTESVEIIFSDTGPGIPAEIKDKIFDPFFTTKGPRSTGLGLSLNFGMIQDHGGVIEVESEKGKGATFVVKLPAIGAERHAKQEEKS